MTHFGLAACSAGLVLCFSLHSRAQSEALALTEYSLPQAEQAASRELPADALHLELISAPQPAAELFAATLADWLERRHILLDFVERPTLDLVGMWRDARPFERVTWVVLSDEGLAQVYFVDVQKQSVLMREVPLSDGLDEYGRELLAQVIAAAARAGEHPGARAAKVESSAERTAPSLAGSSPAVWPAPEAALPEPTSLTGPLPLREVEASPQQPGGAAGARVGVYYGLSLRGGEGNLHGPGASARVELVRGQHVVDVGLKAQYLVPQQIGASRASLQIAAFPVRVGAGVRTQIGGQGEAGLEFGGGIDVVDLTIADTELGASGDLTEVRPVLMLLAVGSLELAIGQLYLGAGLDWQVQPTHYFGESSQGQLVALFSARRAQPVLQLGWHY